VSAAKAAFRSWSKLSFDERAGYLLRFGDALEANRDEFAELLTKEAGKPPPAAAGEVGLAIWGTRVTPHMRLKETTLTDNAEVKGKKLVSLLPVVITSCCFVFPRFILNWVSPPPPSFFAKSQ